MHTVKSIGLRADKMFSEALLRLQASWLFASFFSAPDEAPGNVALFFDPPATRTSDHVGCASATRPFAPSPGRHADVPSTSGDYYYGLFKVYFLLLGAILLFVHLMAIYKVDSRSTKAIQRFLRFWGSVFAFFAPVVILIDMASWLLSQVARPLNFAMDALIVNVDNFGRMLIVNVDNLGRMLIVNVDNLGRMLIVNVDDLWRNSLVPLPFVLARYVRDLVVQDIAAGIRLFVAYGNLLDGLWLAARPLPTVCAVINRVFTVEREPSSSAWSQVRATYWYVLADQQRSLNFFVEQRVMDLRQVLLQRLAAEMERIRGLLVVRHWWCVQPFLAELGLTDSNLSAAAAMALFLSVQVREWGSSLVWRVVLCKPIALGLVALYYCVLVVRSNILSWIVIDMVVPTIQRLVEYVDARLGPFNRRLSQKLGGHPGELPHQVVCRRTLQGITQFIAHYGTLVLLYSEVILFILHEILFFLVVTTLIPRMIDLINLIKFLNGFQDNLRYEILEKERHWNGHEESIVYQGPGMWSEDFDLAPADEVKAEPSKSGKPPTAPAVNTTAQPDLRAPRAGPEAPEIQWYVLRPRRDVRGRKTHYVLEELIRVYTPKQALGEDRDWNILPVSRRRVRRLKGRGVPKPDPFVGGYDLPALFQ